MSLLDFKLPGMDTPEGQGLLSAAFSLLQARRMPGERGIGGALGAAGQQYMGARSQAVDAATRRKLLDANMEEQAAQTAQRKALLAKQTAQDAETARIRSLIGGAGQVRPGMGGGLPDGTLPPELSTGQTFPALQQPGQIDYQSLFRQGVPMDMLKSLSETSSLGRPEVARTMKGMVGGREVDQQFDKFGQPVGSGMEQYKAPIMLDRGGQTDALSPYLQPGASFPKTMTFADKTAQGQLGVSQANLGLAQQRLAFDKAGGAEGSKPQLVDGNWIYKPDAQNSSGRVVPVHGMPDKPLNESQGAAANFGGRALRAHEQLSALELDGGGSPGSIKRFMTAATPGLGMGLDESMGTMTNWTQSKGQQLAEQAQRNFITAVLRKESGASISPGEYGTAAQIYFPQPNDSAEVKAQKKQAREDAINGLRVQAGPGAKNIRPTFTGGASGTFDIPPAAINDLKMRKGDRKAMAQFDEVFGAGAAEKALKGK